MTRVASLYLPHWPIDRLRRAERAHAPPPEAAPAHIDAIGRIAADERARDCSVPATVGWRPGARWARSGVEADVAALPSHQQPPMRELGRSSVAADIPFHTLRADDGSVASPGPAYARWGGDAAATAIEAMPPYRRPPLRELSRRSEVLGHPFRPMPPDEASGAPTQAIAPCSRAPARPSSSPAPYPGEGRFFQTGRAVGSLVARDVPVRPDRKPLSIAVPPIVTVSRSGARVTITAACPVALALGLVPGMALTQARASVPKSAGGLDVRDANPMGDAADLRRLAHTLARRWTPVVACSGSSEDGDGLMLDLTGVAHLHGGEARMARRLVRLLARHGVAARIAVADTVGAAWALARYGGATPATKADTRPRGGPQPGGNGQGSPGWSHQTAATATVDAGNAVRIVPPGEHIDALALLPVAALRLEPSAVELLARLGIATIGQLAAMPRGPLARRFGPRLVARLDQASGRLPEPLDPVIPREPVIARQQFAEPIATAEAIAHWLGELVPRLTDMLARAGLGARLVELVADRVDGVPQTLRIGLARPTRDPAHLLRLIARRIEEIEPGYGIDALALHVRRTDPLGPEPFAPHLAEDAPPDLAPLVDALANRIGAARLWRCVAVESDVPERSVAGVPPLDPPAIEARAPLADDVRRLDERARDHPWHPRWPRPIRLLRRPEPVDNVIAGLPDQPPMRFTWRGHTHRVVQADGPERIAGEWWRRSGEAQAVRDYFHVEDEAGARFWLYRRGDGMRTETGDLRWFLHGSFG